MLNAISSGSLDFSFDTLLQRRHTRPQTHPHTHASTRRHCEALNDALNELSNRRSKCCCCCCCLCWCCCRCAMHPFNNNNIVIQATPDRAWEEADDRTANKRGAGVGNSRGCSGGSTGGSSGGSSVATFQFQRQHFRCLCAFVASCRCYCFTEYNSYTAQKGRGTWLGGGVAAAYKRQFFKQPSTGIQ